MPNEIATVSSFFSATIVDNESTVILKQRMKKSDVLAFFGFILPDTSSKTSELSKLEIV